MSVGTVNRHLALVCGYLHRPIPVTIPKARLEKGRKELLSVKGMTATIADKFAGAGIINGESLIAANAKILSAATGIEEEKILVYQSLMRKKQENAIIRI